MGKCVPVGLLEPFFIIWEKPAALLQTTETLLRATINESQKKTIKFNFFGTHIEFIRNGQQGGERIGWAFNNGIYIT